MLFVEMTSVQVFAQFLPVVTCPFREKIFHASTWKVSLAREFFSSKNALARIPEFLSSLLWTCSQITLGYKIHLSGVPIVESVVLVLQKEHGEENPPLVLNLGKSQHQQ